MRNDTIRVGAMKTRGGIWTAGFDIAVLGTTYRKLKSESKMRRVHEMEISVGLVFCYMQLRESLAISPQSWRLTPSQYARVLNKCVKWYWSGDPEGRIGGSHYDKQMFVACARSEWVIGHVAGEASLRTTLLCSARISERWVVGVGDFWINNVRRSTLWARFSAMTVGYYICCTV